MDVIVKVVLFLARSKVSPTTGFQINVLICVITSDI